MQDLDDKNVLRMVSKGNGLHVNHQGAMEVDYGVFEYASNGELFDMVQAAGGLGELLSLLQSAGYDVEKTVLGQPYWLQVSIDSPLY